MVSLLPPSLGTLLLRGSLLRKQGVEVFVRSYPPLLGLVHLSLASTSHVRALGYIKGGVS